MLPYKEMINNTITTYKLSELYVFEMNKININENLSKNVTSINIRRYCIVYLFISCQFIYLCSVPSVIERGLNKLS